MTIKPYLLGVLEISLYMRDGIGRFNNDLKAFKESFIVLALNIPLIPLSIPHLYKADKNLQVAPVETVIWLFIVKFLLVVVTLVALSYFLCRVLKRGQDFRHYVTASNWTSLTSLILYLPFVSLMVTEMFTYMDLARYLFVIAIYIYSLGAYIARYVLKIPWPLAIAIAIASMAVNEIYFDLLYVFLGQYR